MTNGPANPAPNGVRAGGGDGLTWRRRTAGALTCLAFAALAATPVFGADWKMAHGPLKTKWADEIKADTQPLPEYPRPSMTRDAWQNLNGVWQVKIAGSGQTLPIMVPFPIESALSGVMKRADRFTYTHSFKVPADWRQGGKRTLLHFGAVDWEATVTVNGQAVGKHTGGFDSFTFDVTDALKAGDEQDISVEVFDPTTDGGQPVGKQTKNPGGIFYTPSSGIWQTVWIESVPSTYIGALKITPDVDTSTVQVTADVAGAAAEGANIKVTALDGQTVLGSATGKAGVPIDVKLSSFKPWGPGTPQLYDLKVELASADAGAGDSVGSYFGMRKLEMKKDENGFMRPYINGKFVFMNGPLDQGYWPDGLMTAPTDAALKYDLQKTMELGWNTTRKHIKVEPERWYYHCDQMGLIVWQDTVSGSNRTDADKANYIDEMKRMIAGKYNHPSIVMWVTFNEGWGQFDTPRVVEIAKKADPTRWISNASGWTDMNVGDVHDYHSYPNPNGPDAKNADRFSVCGEYGGLTWPIDDHRWPAGIFGYEDNAGKEKLTRRYEDVLQRVAKLRDEKGMSAAIYTEITDVEGECNGMLTYDRAVMKPDVARVAAANKFDFSMVPPPPVVKAIVPTSIHGARKWKMTTDAPADGWQQAKFDDAAWKTAEGGFGSNGTPGAHIGTQWTSSDIYLRQTFTLDSTQFTDVQMNVHHDEQAEIYINGVLAAKLDNFSQGYNLTEISKEAKAALRRGTNVLAVHCHQETGGQYVDVGIVDVIPGKKK